MMKIIKTGSEKDFRFNCFSEKYLKFCIIFIIITCWCLTPYGAAPLPAQEVYYIPNDSTVGTLTYFETKENLKEAFNNATWIAYSHIFDDKSNVYKSDVNNITEVEYYKTKFVFYADVKGVKDVRSFVYSELKDLKLYIGRDNPEEYRYGTPLNRIDFYWKELKYARQFINALYALRNKNYYQINIADELSMFESKASLYRNTDPKPEPIEEARKCIIQAMTYAKDNNFNEAMKLYEQALKIDDMIPVAHFNLALMYGKIENYDYAILEMKKYLMLVPDAKDSRAAKDKIYEWEANN